MVPDVWKESVAFLFKVSVVHEEFLAGHCNDGKPIIERDSNKSQTAGAFSLWPVCVKLMSLHLPDGRVFSDTQLHNNTPGTTWFIWHQMRPRTVEHTVRVLELVSWSAFEPRVYLCPSLNIRTRSSTLCVVYCQPWV